jgi:hypothetical protein
MGAEKKIGIVMPARNEWAITNKGGLLEKVLEEIPTGMNPTIFVCVNNSNSEFTKVIQDISLNDDRIRSVDLGITNPLSWSYAYLYGLRLSQLNKSDYTIEMDANGSHNPEYIREFTQVLEKGKGAAFSTRFSSGGSVERYPLQRQIISRGSTLLANLTLGLGQYVPDMTSGYQAFSNEVLGDLFSIEDIQKWITVTRGPGHFYQTEMRAKTIWRNNSFEMVPIKWGSDRAEEPEHLPIKTLMTAFQSLVELRKSKELYVKYPKKYS